MPPRRPVPDIAAWFDLCVRPLVALAPGAQDGRRVVLTWAARWLAGSVAGALAGAASLRR